MGVRGFKTRLSKLNTDTSVRLDAKFANFIELVPEKQLNCTKFYILKDVLTPLNSPIYKKGELEDAFQLIDLANIERKTNTLLNLENVYEIGSDKCLIKNGDLVIPKMEPKKGQFFLNLEHKEFLGSTELIEYKINKEKYNPLFLFYLLTSEINLKTLAFLESGKTHKRVNTESLLRIKVPFVPVTLQNSLLEAIEGIRTEISELKNSKLKPSKIINQAFADFFRIDLNKVDDLEKNRILNVSLSSTREFNSALRSGLRWNKMQYIQTHLYSEIDCIHTLGRFIKSTKNGWSPLSVEGGEGIPVLGQENFSFDGILKIEPSKATEETRNNIEDFFIKKGDFFVSRGNTVDLVALASIVNEDIEEDILFPDLYIRLELDEISINKEYLSYIFNSFFGRLYFKYVAKGKNQTMVKVSSTELLNFRLPIPSIDEQDNLVGLIKTQLDEQKVIDRQIEEKQQAIDKIIEDAIKQEQN